MGTRPSETQHCLGGEEPKSKLMFMIKIKAGAELCHAQVKLGLAKLAVNRNKLRAYLLQV